MGKIISRRVAGPDDPMFTEPARSYNPHAGRALTQPQPYVFAGSYTIYRVQPGSPVAYYTGGEPGWDPDPNRAQLYLDKTAQQRVIAELRAQDPANAERILPGATPRRPD